MNSTTSKLWIVLILIFLPVLFSGLLVMNRPFLRVDVGKFTAAQVFGPQVARAKSMSGEIFSRRIHLRNFDFSATKYKEKYPHDIVLASGSAATILSNNEINAYDELSLIDLRWFQLEIYDWRGRLAYGQNVPLLDVLGVLGGAPEVSPEYLDSRRRQIAWAIKKLEP